LVWSGDAESAILNFEIAMRLSPIDPGIGPWTGLMSQAHMHLKKYDEALAWVKKALELHRNSIWAWADKVCILGHMERIDEAQDALAELLRLKPGFSIEFFIKDYPIRDDGYRDHFIKGFRLAGVPED